MTHETPEQFVVRQLETARQIQIQNIAAARDLIKGAERTIADKLAEIVAAEARVAALDDVLIGGKK